MKKPKQLDGWDFADSIQVPDGYDMTRIPDLTRDNFIQLVESHNYLVEVVNKNEEIMVRLIASLAVELGTELTKELINGTVKDD